MMTAAGRRSADGDAPRATLAAMPPAAAGAAEPPFELEALVELCLGQVLFAESLIESFQEDTEANLVKLREFAAAGTLASASDVAHAIKGSAAIVAAGRVRRIAAEIQTAGERGHSEQVRQLTEALAAEVHACRQYLSVVHEKIHAAQSNISDEQDS